MTEKERARAEVLRLEAMLPKLAERMQIAATRLGTASQTAAERAAATSAYQTVADVLHLVQQQRAEALKRAGI